MTSMHIPFVSSSCNCTCTTGFPIPWTTGYRCRRPRTSPFDVVSSGESGTHWTHVALYWPPLHTSGLGPGPRHRPRCPVTPRPRFLWRSRCFRHAIIGCEAVACTGEGQVPTRTFSTNPCPVAPSGFTNQADPDPSFYLSLVHPNPFLSQLSRTNGPRVWETCEKSHPCPERVPRPIEPEGSSLSDESQTLWTVWRRWPRATRQVASSKSMANRCR